MLLQAVRHDRGLVVSSPSRSRRQVVFEPEQDAYWVYGIGQTLDESRPFFSASTMMCGNDSGNGIAHLLGHLYGQFAVLDSGTVFNPMSTEVPHFNEVKKPFIEHSDKVHALGFGRVLDPLDIVSMAVIFDNGPCVVKAKP
jgi:hypothetical protein